MNRNKKNLHKVAANVLGVTLASALVTGAVAETAAPIPVFAAQQRSTDAGEDYLLERKYSGRRKC